MEEKLVKEAVQEAEDDLREKRKQEVKKIVVKTLEKIKSIEEMVTRLKQNLKELEKQKSLLKLDIDDLKEGRLDRMEERQQKDKKAEELSVIKVVKEEHHHHHYDWWREPYKITWNPPIPAYPTPIIYCDSVGVATIGTGTTNGSAWSGTAITLTNCSAKFNTVGTYTIGDDIVHLK